MALPVSPLSRDTVTINGTEVEFRALSRYAVLHMQGLSLDEAERFIVAESVGVTEDEAEEWLRNVSPEDGGILLTGIYTLSGLAKGKGAPKA